MALLLGRKPTLGAYDQAVQLRESALAGFRSAHETLSQANALLAQEREDQRLAAIAYREQLENAIKIAERRQADALALAESNQTSIDLLAGLLGQ